MAKRCVSVVVLGDFGRSPRMQYHTLSFAREGYEVDVIGYGGSQPIKEIIQHPRITIHNLVSCPDFQKYCPRLLSYMLKVVWQTITLFCALLFKRRSHHIIVQNPPSIPTLAVCWFYSVVMFSNYVIDWHNYGYTMLALSLHKKHKLVHLSLWFEGYFGKKANANLCVTRAMKEDLAEKWGVKAVTLYDRPPEAFHPIPVSESHKLFLSLAKEYPLFGSEKSCRTLFTEEQEDGEFVWRNDRPGLIISSTSWTEDEDITLLLKALQEYENAKCSEESEVLPALVCVITGKGPMKEYYSQQIKEKCWKHIHIITPWLEPEDYPRLLASADLGVSLHTSSSGLDLPMKVVDMFGCGLPVCAYNFPCGFWELVKHDVNGWQFDDWTELSIQILSWFRGFPKSELQKNKNERFKKELTDFQKLRWHENWT
ncbi:hypothetical protein L9F63_012396, partial [Diploptera punctata]